MQLALTTASDIVGYISTVGFPIVACAAMFWLCNTTIKESTEAVNKCNTTMELVAKQLEDVERRVAEHECNKSN